MSQRISGFSKFTKEQKIDWIVAHCLDGNVTTGLVLKQYWSQYEQLQELHDNFSENTVSNYYIPFGLAPNFLIDGEIFTIPMAIEESSVVAAASKAAKFWLDRGGFTTSVHGMIKTGQIHLEYHGLSSEMDAFYAFAKAELLQATQQENESMKKRGGGLLSLSLENKTEALEGYYTLHATLDTKDAMGANFINTILEGIADAVRKQAQLFKGFSAAPPEVTMSILSNYVPECTVHAQVRCAVDDLGTVNGLSGAHFAKKMVRAVAIARVEPYRAVTHNKGIMNGIDAVVMATGNDARAIEAGVHAYASRDGQYRSLTQARIEDGHFIFEGTFPLALGTVGGLTSLHPLSKVAMEILGNPDAQQLMKITAVCGLAQNFAALHSLVTTGIQKGHMKMHLANMLEQIGATTTEKQTITKNLGDTTPSVSLLKEMLSSLRENK